MGSAMHGFMIICCISVFLGLPSNILVLLYFSLGRVHMHPAMKLLHVLIVITDIFISITLVPFVMMALSSFNMYQSNNYIMCQVVEFAGDLWIRVSYILICTMAVFRAIITRTIKKPRQRLNHRPVQVFVGLTCTLLVIQSLIPLVIRHVNLPKEEWCQAKLEHTFTNKTVYRVWTLVTILLQPALALVVMVIANTITMYHLLHDEGRRRSRSERVARNFLFAILHRGRHSGQSVTAYQAPSQIKTRTYAARVSAAKITLLLTFIFFVLHILGLVKFTCKLLDLEIIDGYIANAMVFLNPTMNCIVYGLKFKGFWVFWKDVGRGFVRWTGITSSSGDSSSNTDGMTDRLKEYEPLRTTTVA